MLTDNAFLDEFGSDSQRSSAIDIGDDQELINPQDDQTRPLLNMADVLPVTPPIKPSQFRSRKTRRKGGRRQRRKGDASAESTESTAKTTIHPCRMLMCRCCCRTPTAVQSTLTCMNVLAKLLLWATVVSLAAAVVWYSYELFNHGTDAHLIAWFSAGAFVILGFPISMFGIVSHLANYNQPHVQVYVVRILWMVPIYSIESWLAMRFHDHAIYIETLRDLYESYVLYSFTQFLIQVLGGEESLILMLKDKSPTRGVHMWGLQWCVKPWLMGQPVRKTVYERDDESGHKRAMKRVHWKSPFFINCKFGVLQYVLLKFLSAVAVLLLEWKGLYKEGNFTYKGGYLYICILTNLSQCWALYCLIFFYYATKTELSPIRPVGKFLSVKALVFFTWWQSVAISILYQMDLIPEYRYAENDWSPEDVAKFLQDYLICIEMFLAAVVHTFVFPHSEYSPQAVEARTRALNQMPMKHRRRLGRTKYTPTFPYYKDDSSKCSTTGEMELATFDSGNSVHSAETWDDQPLATPSPFRQATHSRANSLDTDDSMLSPSWEMAAEDAIMRAPEAIAEGEEGEETERHDDSSDRDYSDNDDGDDDYEEYEEEDVEAMSDVPSVTSSQKPGFVRALLDSAIPLDLRENTVGIVRGDYHVERKTLLQHATTSDQYDLFAHRRPFKRKEPQSP